MRKSLYILLHLIAIIAIILLIVSPSHLVEQAATRGILCTNNTDSLVLDSILKLEHGERIIQVESITEAIEEYPTIKKLHLIGDGLPIEDLDTTSPFQILPHLNPIPNGILDVHYTRNINLGESFEIAVKAKGKGRILLETSEGLVDSSRVEGTSNTLMNYLPRSEGHFLYYVNYKDSLGKQTERLPLPVWIEKDKLLEILIVNSSPNFETKYLKQYLAKRGHRLLIRTQISKEQFRHEAFNRSKKTFKIITPRLLRKFDLVYIDDITYGLCTSSEQKAIQRAISSGMSVFQPFTKTEVAPTTIKLPDGSRIETTKAKDNVLPKNYTEVSLYNNENQAIAVYKTQGLGRWYYTNLANTYTLILEGEKASYEALWSHHLKNTVQQFKKLPIWDIPYPAFQHERLIVGVQTNQPDPQAIYMHDGDTVPLNLKQDLFLEDEYRTIIYPLHTGWASMSLGDKATEKQFYTSSPAIWHTPRTYQQIITNNDHFSTLPIPDYKVVRISERYPHWWWFLLFLFAMTGIWILEKTKP